MNYKKSKLTIDGLNIAFIAKKFTTPIYCWAIQIPLQ